MPCSRPDPMLKPQIVIAEDDALIVCDMKDRLESLGYEVLGTAPRAREALVLVDNLKPDMVLMDIQLPGEMDGITAAAHIRMLHNPVVYATDKRAGRILYRAMW